MGEIHKKVLSLLSTENEVSVWDDLTAHRYLGVYVSKTTLVLTYVMGFIYETCLFQVIHFEIQIFARK